MLVLVQMLRAHNAMYYNFFAVVLILSTYLSLACGRLFPKNLADFPFAVSVTITSNGAVVRECTGSIVSENHVLTTMICVHVPGNKIVSGYVRAGADIIDSDGDIHPIKKIHKHDHYDNTDFRDNVALIAVYNFFDFTTYINEIPLNWDFIYKPGEVQVVGFMGDGNDRKKIHQFSTSTVSITECISAYAKHSKSDLIRQETLCVARPKDPKICDIAPGAALLRYHKLIGVFTYRLDNCAGQDEPILFSLISHYTLMMNKIIDPQIFDRPLAYNT